MLVLVASRHDATAGRLVERWRPHGAALLSCEDLSRPGWIHDLDHPDRGTAVVEGSVVDVRRIRAVLTLRPFVFAAELRHVAAEDRAYVAAEMNAFLVSWLSSLACPVLNRPTPSCLSGPSLRPEQWVHKAARAGLRVRPFVRSVPARPAPAAPAPDVEVTVVGGRCLGTEDDGLARDARRLARAAGVDLLAVRFHLAGDGAVFAGASPWLDLAAAPLADAVLDALLQGAR